MSEASEKKSLFTNLWDRRFFQFFATYIAASWGAIQALEWAVRRYNLPSEWVDRLVLLLIALLPLVISVIYFHGRPGDDKWLKFEKIFYPINVVLALMMSIFLVSSTAKNTTEQVTITNEEGNVEIRDVPKSQYSKKVALFPVDEPSGDPSWKGIAISEMLDRKLEQDMRVICSSAMGAAELYDDYGFEKLSRIPFATKVNIAEDMYADYMVDSRFVDDGHQQVESQIFDVRAGRELASEVITGTDIYDMTDKINALVNKHIKLQEVEGAELYMDLPSKDLLSPDTSALRHFINGNVLLALKPAETAAYVAEFQKSVDNDQSCVECLASLSRSFMLSGQDPTPAMKKAMKFVNNVSERQQLFIKHVNYLSSNETEKATKLNEMWIKLYPQDIKPVNNLLQIYGSMLRKDEARALAKSAIERGHGGKMYLTYARMMIESKEYDEAEIYIQKYKSEYPKQFEATLLLVDVLDSKGQSDKAMEALEELILMKPNENQYKLRKAALLSKQNNFSAALSLLNTNLSEVELVEDSIRNYSEQLKVLARALQFGSYYNVRSRMKSVYMRNFPPIAFLQTEYATIGYYKDIGQMDSIRISIDGITSTLPPGQKTMIANVNEFILDLFDENVDRIDESYDKVRPMFEATGSKLVGLIYKSEISYIKGDYEEALLFFAEYAEEVDDVALISLNYLECYLKLDQYKEGLKTTDGFLKEDPLNPLFNLYKTIFLEKLGNESEAKKILQSVMPIFRASDQRYKMTKVANELAEKLGV